MSTTQITACRPKPYVRIISQSHRLPSNRCILAIRDNCLPRTSLRLSANASYHQQCMAVSNYQQSMPVCSLGGEGNKEGGNGGSPWKAIQNVIGRFKGKSLEDELRQRIEKKGYYDDSGGDGIRPPGGGGGGGGGGGDASGGSEDEGLAGIVDETLQVILATIGFIFMYVYIINGEEMTRLAKDYIKYLFGGNQSARLRRAMYKWGRFYKKLTQKKKTDPLWLEKSIINTTTWWDSPEKYRRLVRALESNSDQE
ncbi:hypothetical protein F2P56_027551 [Juglans regia]|uniref:Uncharacterized protein LOC108980800 n=2 Tax=Juglans regia TaxID=51240 RepID=A0A2I4DJM3_JUGRE|nr:uncharacterized protein LOC108980800 [Juglans regia]XP_018807362.1 uncharacterized protein LOC108980800 [Juglans regia]KAF5452571.1 hypothetical protein F2P56_027551 [Juglans regia]